MAVMMGLGTRLLVPLADPMLLAKAALTLGVLEIPRRLFVDARWFKDCDPRDDARLPLLFPLKDSRRTVVVECGLRLNSVVRRNDPTGL